MFNQDQLNPGLILGSNIHPSPTTEQTRPTSTSALHHVLGADPVSLSRLLLPGSSGSSGSQASGSRSCRRFLLLQFHLHNLILGRINKRWSIVRQDYFRSPVSSENYLLQRYIHQIFWHRSSLRYATPFWLGNDSLVRAAAAPEVKIPATLLLWEHYLLGSDSSTPAILGLFLLDFLWDGHFGKDCILLLHWVRSVNSESAVTDSRYKTLDLPTASSFSCHSRQSLSSESNSSTLCFSCSSINSTTLASSLKSLRCNSRRLHRLLGRKSAT